MSIAPLEKGETEEVGTMGLQQFVSTKKKRFLQVSTGPFAAVIYDPFRAVVLRHRHQCRSLFKNLLPGTAHATEEAAGPRRRSALLLKRVICYRAASGTKTGHLSLASSTHLGGHVSVWS